MASFLWTVGQPAINLRDEVANSLLRKNRIHLMTKEDEIPYNDCFYRNLGQFDYISVLDVDEVCNG